MARELTNDEFDIVWKPFIRQRFAMKSGADETLFGGSRGGGKTDAGLHLILNYIDYPDARILVLRRNAVDLSDWIDRAKSLFPAYGGEVKGSPARVEFPSGAKVYTGHMADKDAYTKYLGHEYILIIIEELTTIPTEDEYIKIMGSCRSSNPKLPKPRMWCTTNPGNIGHAWVLNRFKTTTTKDTYFFGKDGNSRIYIPATIDDNPALLRNDPRYVRWLDGLKLTNKDLWKAWRWGDWTTFKGQAFTEWNDPGIYIPSSHVLTRDIFPTKAEMFVGGLDWGYSAKSAYAFYLLGVVPMQVLRTGETFNRIVVTKEFYGNQTAPSPAAKKWSQAIAEDPRFDGLINDIVYDSAIGAVDQKGDEGLITTIRDEFEKSGITTNWVPSPGKGDRGKRPADKAMLHNWLSLAPDGVPYMVVNPSCENLRRTLPMLVYDENKVDDVNTAGEDHAYDAIRYALNKIRFMQVSQSNVILRAIPLYSQSLNGNKNLIDLKEFE